MHIALVSRLCTIAGRELGAKLPATDLEEGVSTVMLSTSSSASFRRPCLTGRVTTTYLRVSRSEAQLTQQPLSISLRGPWTADLTLPKIPAAESCCPTGVA